MGVELTEGRLIVHGPLVRPGDTGLVLGMAEGLARVLSEATGTVQPGAIGRTEPG
jgi:hypothetical protein